jgi:hypothetical protein
LFIFSIELPSCVDYRDYAAFDCIQLATRNRIEGNALSTLAHVLAVVLNAESSAFCRDNSTACPFNPLHTSHLQMAFKVHTSFADVRIANEQK